MNIVDVLLRRGVVLFLPFTIFGQMAPPFTLETESLFHQGGSLSAVIVSMSIAFGSLRFEGVALQLTSSDFP